MILERNCRETGEKLETNSLIYFSVRSMCHEKTSPNYCQFYHVSEVVVETKKHTTANLLHFARISALSQKTTNIELVVRKEDSTSNRRLSSLNFNLYLSLSLSIEKTSHLLTDAYRQHITSSHGRLP